MDEKSNSPPRRRRLVGERRRRLHAERPLDELAPAGQEAAIVDRPRVLDERQGEKTGVAELPPRQIVERAEVHRQARGRPDRRSPAGAPRSAPGRARPRPPRAPSRSRRRPRRRSRCRSRRGRSAAPHRRGTPRPPCARRRISRPPTAAGGAPRSRPPPAWRGNRDRGPRPGGNIARVRAGRRLARDHHAPRSGQVAHRLRRVALEARVRHAARSRSPPSLGGSRGANSPHSRSATARLEARGMSARTPSANSTVTALSSASKPIPGAHVVGHDCVAALFAQLARRAAASAAPPPARPRSRSGRGGRSAGPRARPASRSGTGVSSSVRSPPPAARRESLPAARIRGRKSATAAAMTTASASGRGRGQRTLEVSGRLEVDARHPRRAAAAGGRPAFPGPPAG